MTGSHARVGYDDPSQRSCKTNRHGYDFAVKCAVVLLAELGGAKCITCDDCTDLNMNTWWDAIDWLAAQDGLPDAYPIATHDILYTASTASQQLNPEEQVELLHAGMSRRCDSYLRWLLSVGNPQFAKIRVAADIVADALKQRAERRREKMRAWIPRLVYFLQN